MDEIRSRLDRIAAANAEMRAFIRVDREDALAAAARANGREQNGRSASRLDCLAVAVKDNIAVAGKPWTAGIAGRQELLANADADAVAKLRAAGAILLGGTNMEEAALGAVTDNPTFGRCINPLGAGLTPGGSSGGSAAAVAAGFVDLALGTDTMGSVRVPAAYCGIAGIKPTFGALDRGGLAMLCPSLDTIGPMARDVTLLWHGLLALASAEAKTAWMDPPGRSDLAGLSFGLPAQMRSVESEPAVLAGLDRAVEQITRLGGTVQEIVLDGWDPHKARRAGLLVIEAEGSAELTDLMDHPGAISDHLRSMLVYGRDAPAEKLAAARAEIERASKSAESALTEVDAILLPTAPQRAFLHGTRAPANQADLTALANFAGCPAVALPVALPGEALPASIQLLGPKWSEPRLLAWAEALAPSLI